MVGSAAPSRSSPDGKIVAAGFTESDDFAVARYDPDGSLDQSFGSGGKVVTDFDNSSADIALAAALAPDGKIVVAGGSDAGGALGGFDFALVHYNVDGSLDQSFGSDGKILTDLGSLDDSFGSFGKVLTHLGTVVDIATDVALEPDGKIVVAGGSEDTQGFEFVALARYNPDGSLDHGFGSGGTIVSVFPGIAGGVEIQSDGKIVAAGGFGLARYNVDGSLDVNFGSDGRVPAEFAAWDVALDSGGKIVAAGASGDDFAVARYNADGSLDESFGSGGKVVTDFDNGGDYVFAVAVQPDHRIVVVGDSGFALGLVRYLGEAEAVAVLVDIKPGSDTNPINLRSKGVIPVAILSTASFDATTVDPASVCFGDADDASQRDCTEAHGTGHLEDVNGDGRLDLLLHFETQQTGIDPGDTQACLTGKTFTGVDIQGCDSVTTV